MSGPLDSITSAIVSKALDVSLQTHQVIANNIANSQTEGFKAHSVDFDEIMQNVKSAVASGADANEIRSALSSVEFSSSMDASESSVMLDQQIISLTKNTTHYQALISARGKLGELMSLAIKGGQQ